ncbi:hypothetical protein COU86_01735 [Candidatus Roizmanbacteria bacterium CG10_big_fil_rev_8_21_14_0_10_36_26]|uniref:Uncharacterized protein n=1 Tax=Candidatus Roizmanbacteria bacterium CG10_big_fil_rev_8_21_14_0_10_36_26 TaxID=1974851 RepID=A0A2M8KLY7_9BACT|nr:MAG: hypothetical protein COU86_01735 [Candidatus Roizmanbacteria bacterium CG10_big_fil_rev_8_21_14_0_10_36_26]
MNTVSIIKKIAIIILCLFLAGLVAAFFQGFLGNIGGNITLIGFGKLSFDPLITIAYIMVNYFISLFYQPAPKTQYYLFLLTIFLSFTKEFIQGSVILIFFYFFLRKFKII